MGCIHSANPTPMERLVRSTIENTPKLVFDGRKMIAKVLEVHDGDTITVAFIIEGGMIFQGKCRLDGIDAAEITHVESEEERNVGIQARDYLSKVILDQMVTIVCPSGEHDKYGRSLIGTIYLDETRNMNEEMIFKGFAYRYYGGKKKKFSEWYGIEEKTTFWECCGYTVQHSKRCPSCESWSCTGCPGHAVHRKATAKCGKCKDRAPK
jgi:endonuclease YncB( thermonuclease family)